MNNRCAGFTLIEMMISLGIFSVLLLTVGQISRTIVGGLDAALADLETQQVAQTTMSILSRELQVAKVDSLGLNPPTLTFLVPVDVGEDDNGNLVLDAGEDADNDGVLDLTDGDFIGSDGSVQWGSVETSGPRLNTASAPHQVTLSYVFEANVSESSINSDINGDGDTADVFRRGFLRYETSEGRRVDYGRGMVLLGTSGPAEDIDGDGNPDPLFDIRGEFYIDQDLNRTYSKGETFTDSNGNGKWDGRIRLNLWILKSYGDNRVVLANSVKVWKLQDV